LRVGSISSLLERTLRGVNVERVVAEAEFPGWAVAHFADQHHFTPIDPPKSRIFFGLQMA
jgi:hypothetical protein